MNQDTVQELSAYFPRLDDFYEEGEWEPVYSGGGTYGLQSGNYTRIGRMVFATISLTWSGATGTDPATFTLPMAASTASDFPATITVFNYGADPAMYAYIGPGGISVDLWYPNNSPVAIVASGEVHITATYFIDA